jgi:hypothetical protein
VCEIFLWTPKLTLDCQKEMNHSKDVLKREIEHMKSVFSQTNAFEWDWLDDTLVKIQNSQVYI